MKAVKGRGSELLSQYIAEEHANVTSQINAVFDYVHLSTDEIRRVWVKHIHPTLMLFACNELDADSSSGTCFQLGVYPL